MSEKIRAWSVTKEGVYTASREFWITSCISTSRKGAIERATRIAGETWGKCQAAGLRPIRITIEVEA